MRYVAGLALTALVGCQSSQQSGVGLDYQRLDQYLESRQAATPTPAVSDEYQPVYQPRNTTPLFEQIDYAWVQDYQPKEHEREDIIQHSSRKIEQGARDVGDMVDEILPFPVSTDISGGNLRFRIGENIELKMRKSRVHFSVGVDF